MEGKVYALYYSPTYTSKKNVIAIAQEFGSVSAIDLTKEGPKETTFSEDDLVVFGAPVYGGRIPVFAMERFKCFKGNNTKCVITVTYGNRDYDDALLEFSDMTTENGFCIVACASLIGEHTYGTIQIGRPNEVDILQHKNFAKQIQLKIEKGIFSPIEVKGNRPYKTGGTGGSFRPLTNSDLCVNCGLCKRECPMNAIGEDNKTIDSDKCIACFRCIKNCPLHAKNMDTPEYEEFACGFTKRLETAKENEYFL